MLHLQSTAKHHTANTAFQTPKHTQTYDIREFSLSRHSLTYVLIFRPPKLAVRMSGYLQDPSHMQIKQHPVPKTAESQEFNLKASKQANCWRRSWWLHPLLHWVTSPNQWFVQTSDLATYEMVTLAGKFITFFKIHSFRWCQLALAKHQVLMLFHLKNILLYSCNYEPWDASFIIQILTSLHMKKQQRSRFTL